MKKGILKAMLVGTLAVTLSVAGILTACGEGGGDYSSPVITVDPLTVTLDQGTQNVDLLDGVTVTDEYDKDLKATVSDNGGFTTATVGEYTVTYTATNSHDKTGTATRKYTVREAGEYSAPVITVTPDTMEFEEGADDVSLTFGVTVSDEYDTGLSATVKSIIGENNEEAEDVSEMTAGTWVVTYTATNSKGKEGTATRTYTVTKAASNYIIEVQKENDANWVAKCGRESKKLVLDPKWYYEYSEDTSVNAAKSGIYRNMSENEITVDVIGGYGQVAIFTADGFMIEARDGANGKLVNADNPVRTASTLTTYPGTSTTIASACAKDMKIPAHGFAIVIFQGLLDKPGTEEAESLSAFDYDGRGWFNKNAVYQYGCAVKVYLQDDPTQTITTAYENHAPVVLTKADVSEFVNSTATLEQIKAKLAEGVTYVDDNGTFDPADDVKTGLTITVGDTSTPALDLTAVGSYVYELTISDGTLSTTFTRTLNVKASTPTVATIIIDGTWHELGNNVVVNPTSTSGLGSKSAIIYTSYFTGTKFANNWGAYFIVGADGKVRESYHPGNNKIYTAGNLAGTAGSANDVLAQASPLAAGEYIVLAVNGGSPDWRTTVNGLIAASDRMIGKDVSLALIDYQPTLTANGSKYTPINLAVNVNNANKTTYDMFIYTYGYTGSFADAVSGQVMVVNASGEITYIFDGANGRVHLAGHEALGNGTNDNTEGVRFNWAGYNAEYGTNISGSDYISHAFSKVESGGYLVLAPNDPNRSQIARNWTNGLRTHIGKVVTLGNLWLADVSAAPQASIKVGTNTFTPDNAGVNVNNATLSEYDVLVYTKGFTGTVPEYDASAGTAAEIGEIKRGVAVVVGADGNVKTVFDSANGYVHFAGHTGLATDNSDGNRLNFATYNSTNELTGDNAVTRGNYVKLAVDNLADGEYVIFFVYDAANTAAQQFALNNVRQQIGAKVELTAIDLNA